MQVMRVASIQDVLFAQAFGFSSMRASISENLQGLGYTPKSLLEFILTGVLVAVLMAVGHAPSALVAAFSFTARIEQLASQVELVLRCLV